MEFGIQTFNAEFPQLRERAQAAEHLGFDLICFPDHFVMEGVEGGFDPRALAHDSMMVAAAVAEATRKIRVGHLVLCNLFRHPAITAQSLMSLDHLSGGRAIAGVGTGWTESEFKMTGIGFPEIGARLRMLDEALDCMRALWTKERSTFDGEFYRLRDAILWPKPLQKPHPPILLGGGGNGLLRVAAKHADYVNIIIDAGRAGKILARNIGKLTDDAYRGKVRFLREEARKAGRDPNAIKISNVMFNVILTDSRAATEQAARTMAGAFGQTPEQALHSPVALIGTPDECASELSRRAKEWEVSQFIFSTGDEATMRVLSEKVIPQVKSAPTSTSRATR